ncbi:MAG: ABC transporter ATP-binding protein [Bacteroides sp.]|nr:ABC transporter ATP-binding protein [Bacteroides sp.]
MLQVENLTFSYARGKKNTLSNFSLSIEKGKVYGLLGKNGAGKSTLLCLMSGLLTPKSGRVMYRDVDVRRRLPISLRDMFFVPEEFELPSVSLKSYVKYNASFYPRFSYEDLEQYLRMFGMDTDIHLGQLSMGQKKKVFMSFALAANTSLLLMDEPTNGLDIPGKSQFRKMIAMGMNDERSIVVSTHQVRDIDRILDHVVIMNESSVLLDASMSDISSRLLFVESDDRSLLSSAIYALPSLQGNLLMLPNEGVDETPVNIELLFGAVLEKPQLMAEMFHLQNEQKL